MIKKIVILVILSVTLIFSTCVEARNSVYTQSGAGPLYWIAYEHCFTNDAYIPEDRWQANIDWINNNFKSYGYNMVCIDGWGDVNSYNSNGYRTKHSSQWTHDYAYWSDYCQDRDMTLGIYNNPLWVSKAAVDAGCTVVGTNTPLSALVSSSDMFAADQYWVNVDHADAEAYVKGYVNFYKNMGVHYLRVDFLSWYETATDKGNVVQPVAHGSERYEKALRWMKEACGDTMELSLVMPHLNNIAAAELAHGDMVRINEDCWTGSWYRFSDMDRGIKRNCWSQYANAFDGLIYWSQYFGKGKIIADADMLRLNTFSNDAERMAAVSLCVMSGAPVCIADQYDTIGNSAWIYQNSELLALNSQGFVGKPIKSDPLDNYNSQRWIGMLEDGSWIVGLFNREADTPTQWRGVDFWIDLGINGSCTLRDLWGHADFGPATYYGLDMIPKSTFVFKVTPPSTAIKNGGFETRDISGWTAANTANLTNFGVDNSDVSTGQYKLYFWSGSPYWQTIYQTKTGLANGSYTVKAKCKQNTGTPYICRMELSDYGGAATYTNISHTSAYTEYTSTVQVTNGQLKVGFYNYAPGYTNLQVDDVQIIKN